MAFKITKLWVLWLALALTGSPAHAGHGGGSGGEWLLKCPVNSATAVRFFFNPETANYYHFPLIFRAVGPNDPRLNTAPMGPEGRTAYVTRANMKRLIQGLARAEVSWTESTKVEQLGSFHRLYPYRDLRILVVCSRGTARAKVQPKKICGVLAPLDHALSTPRALWEFQLLRIGYGCKVPGLNTNAYPGRN